MEVLARFERKYCPEALSGCWIWMAGCHGPDGYGTFDMNGKSIAAHRAAYKLFVGTIPKGKLVLHRCDVPSCVNPGHLFIGSIFDNNRDRKNKGRTYKPLGEKAPAAKLTRTQVLEIRSSNEKYRVLGERYGVLISTICSIKKRRNWAWLK